MSVLGSVSLDFYTAMLLVVVFLLSLLFAWYASLWRSGFPRGPTPLPIIGNIHQIAWRGNNNIGKTLTDWGKEYGDIFTVYFGGDKSLILSSYDVIKEAFSSQLFSGRPYNLLTDAFGYKGLIVTEGHLWDEQKRFSITHLKELGMGKTIFEDKINEEIKVMLDTIKTDQPFDIKNLLKVSITNIVTSVLMSKRYDYSDERLLYLIKLSEEYFTDGFKVTALDKSFPILRHLPSQLIGYDSVYKLFRELHAFMQEIIEERKNNLSSSDGHDFLSVYLQTMEREKGDTNTTFTENQLQGVLSDLVFATFETGPNTVYWGLYYLALYPNIQEKAAEEVLGAIGKSRSPSMKDRPNLPYLDAVITETHRVGRVAPTGFPHAPTSDVVFRDIAIPKGTTVIPNMTAVFMDEREFPDPYRFYPERYLDVDGKPAISSADHVIPFGIGRRVCPGESLARMDLLLYMASILQKFKVTVPQDRHLPSPEGILGITRSPGSFELQYSLRQ